MRTRTSPRKKCSCSHHRGHWKPCFDHMNPAEAKLRRAMPDGMRDGIDVRIELHTGFEDWGTYETWGSGWVITGKGFRVTAYSLDEAVDKFVAKVNGAREGEDLKAWQSYMSPTLRIMLEKNDN